MVCMFAVYVEVCASCSIHIHRNWLLILNAILLWGTNVQEYLWYEQPESWASGPLNSLCIFRGWTTYHWWIVNWKNKPNQTRQDHTRPYKTTNATWSSKVANRWSQYDLKRFSNSPNRHVPKFLIIFGLSSLLMSKCSIKSLVKSRLQASTYAPSQMPW